MFSGKSNKTDRLMTLSIFLSLFFLHDPTVVFSASFMCKNAATKQEHLICADETLSKLDEILSLSYEKALDDTMDPNSIRTIQKKWLSERDTCLEVECLIDSYNKQIKYLSNLWLFRINKPQVIPGINENPDLEVLYASVRNLRRALKKNDAHAVSELINYPLTRQEPAPPILDKDQFVLRYKEVFDEYLVNEIVKSVPDEEWSKVGNKGYMFRSGALWLNPEGKVLSVNYQTLTEMKLASTYQVAFDRPVSKELGYGVENKRFITNDGHIPAGCFGPFIISLSGDLTVAAVFLGSKETFGCIEAGDKYPGGIGEEVSYEIVDYLGSDVWELNVCEVVHGSLRENCDSVTVRFVNREYGNRPNARTILSLENVGGWWAAAQPEKSLSDQGGRETESLPSEGCIRGEAKYDICAIARKLVDGITPELPLVLNGDMIWEKLYAVDNKVEGHIRYPYDRAYLEGLTSANSKKLDELKNLAQMSFNQLCEEELWRTFFGIGGVFRMIYTYSDGERFTTVEIGECQ